MAIAIATTRAIAIAIVTAVALAIAVVTRVILVTLPLSLLPPLHAQSVRHRPVCCFYFAVDCKNYVFYFAVDFGNHVRRQLNITAIIYPPIGLFQNGFNYHYLQRAIIYIDICGNFASTFL